jgi:hypothetical protein
VPALFAAFGTVGAARAAATHAGAGAVLFGLGLSALGVVRLWEGLRAR